MYRVLIDTSAYENEGCLFSGEKFDSLVELNKGGFIRMVTSDIIIKEIENHISKSVASFGAALKRTLKEADHITRVDLGAFAYLKKDSKSLCENLVTRRIKTVHKFFNSIEVERLENKHIDLSEVIDNYFRELPPFSGKKKSEFPDAFILSAFINKYKSILEDTCVVSSDKDFQSFCSQHPNIKYFESIASLIDFVNSKRPNLLFPRLHSIFERRYDDIKEYIWDWILNNADFVYDNAWINPEGEIDDDSIDIELMNPKLISQTNKSAIFELNVTVRYDVNLSASDPDSMVKDYETRDWFFLEPLYLFGSIEKKFDVVIPCVFSLEDLELSFKPEPFELPSNVYELDNKDFEEVRGFNE